MRASPKKTILTLLTAAALTGSSLGLFAATDEDRLAQARKLVEQKSYSEALDIYSRLDPFLRRDPGLIVEWARVHSYADHHQEAIALFEQVRSSHPEKENEILRELANQYKWGSQPAKAIKLYEQALKSYPDNWALRLDYAQALAWDGRHDAAIAEYRSIAASHPENLDAVRGEAEVLSWQDRLEESAALYRTVLERDPSDVGSKNALAKLLVWQGYHREGRQAYELILREHPDNPDALEGIAFAEHWDGRDDLADAHTERLLTIAPERHENAQLYNQIKSSRSIYISGLNGYSIDQNKLSILSHGARGGTHIDPRTAVEGIYQWTRYRQKPDKGQIIGNRAGLGINRILTEELEGHSFLYANNYSVNDSNPFTTNTWLTYRPDDRWRFDGAYDRETVDDMTALANSIIINCGSISADLSPNRFWFFSGRFKRGRYSDGNFQNTIFSKAELRILRRPFAKLYYNYYYSAFAHQFGHGYFNPFSIASHTLGLYASEDITPKIFLDGHFASGYEIQNPIADHPTYSAALGLNWRISDNWLLSLSADYFNARPDPFSRGYSKTSFFLGATYNFGASPTPLREASQPARRTGG